jgi:very-short-patch-repair endonuclease/ribosomal protein L37AE/L43A
MVVILVVIFLIVIAIAVFAALKAKQPRAGDGGLAFESREALFTPAERSFLGVLEQALANSHCRVFGKVRLGDIVKPAKGLTASKRTTAQNRINQKHVDFLICTTSDLAVVGVVELDDQSHGRDDRAGRDSFVDEALSMARIPVVRFPAKKSYALPEVTAKLQGILTDLQASTFVPGNAEEKISESVTSQVEQVNTVTPPADAVPVCQKCSSEMVKRQAKNGPHAGKFFWACSTYPKCKNVIAIEV